MRRDAPLEAGPLFTEHAEPCEAQVPANASRIEGPDNVLLQARPGELKRAVREATSHSGPVPTQFGGDRALWAQAWLREHGMTLPPLTTEYKSLRNWFCFQYQRWKKGSTTEEETAKLAALGIDFSQYKALNTGKGEREDDGPRIAQMRRWHEQHGSYDLTEHADAGLIKWQGRLLAQFAASGRSKRLGAIERQLPGLEYGRWRRPGDTRAPDAQWWLWAKRFRIQSQLTPAFRGVLHPDTPPDLLEWAEQQRHRCAKGDVRASGITAGQRGELHDLGVLGQPAQRAVHKRRENVRKALVGPERLPPSDRRLTTFLGAALLVRLLAKDSDTRALWVELAISPADCERLLAATARQRKQLRERGFETLRRLLPTCRQLDTAYPGIFAAASLRRLRDPARGERPAVLTGDIAALGALIEQIRLTCVNMQLPQDLA